MDACFGPAPTEAASEHTKKYARAASASSTFITPGGYLDVGACIKKVNPRAAARAPSTASMTAGRTRAAAATRRRREARRSTTTVSSRQSDPSGSCWEFGAKDYDSCTSDPELSVCVPATVDALLPFFRGGCRDGGDWTKAETPDGTL